MYQLGGIPASHGRETRWESFQGIRSSYWAAAEEPSDLARGRWFSALEAGEPLDCVNGYSAHQPPRIGG